MYIITVQIGQTLTKVVAAPDEARDFKVGDRVLVAAKAFNPIILKLPWEVLSSPERFGSHHQKHFLADNSP